MGQAFSCVSSDKKNRKSSHSKEKPRRKEGLKKEGSNELDFHSLEELFQVYAGGEDVIGVDGIIQFCSDIGVALEDPMMLLISYFMGAKEQGQYTKEEFVGGFSKLQVDSINKIQNKIPEWRAMLDPRHPNFKDIFKYTFRFSSAGSKLLELELAEELLPILLEPNNPHSIFCTFLQQSNTKCLNLDQWMSFLEFSQTIGGPETNFAGYDVNDPWPILLDEYVTWATANPEPTTTTNSNPVPNFQDFQDAINVV